MSVLEFDVWSPSRVCWCCPDLDTWRPTRCPYIQLMSNSGPQLDVYCPVEPADACSDLDVWCPVEPADVGPEVDVWCPVEPADDGPELDVWCPVEPADVGPEFDVWCPVEPADACPDLDVWCPIEPAVILLSIWGPQWGFLTSEYSSCLRFLPLWISPLPITNSSEECCGLIGSCKDDSGRAEILGIIEMFGGELPLDDSAIFSLDIG